MNVRSMQILCADMIDYTPETEVAFCVLTVRDSIGVRYLMMKRDIGIAIPEPGMWALFGGRMELGETSYETIVREIKEETELDARKAVHLGTMKVTMDECDGVFHIFHLDVTDQFNSREFKCHEGLDWNLFTAQQIEQEIYTHQRTRDFIYMHQFNKIAKTKSVAMCHGVFDVLHHDHIRLFNLAKTYADYLIVSVVADRFVDKGPDRPIVDEVNRMFTLSSLKAVDKVIITRSLYPFDNIRCFKPNYYVHGKIEDHLPEDDLLAELGVIVIVREGGHNAAYRATSSSKIIEGMRK